MRLTFCYKQKFKLDVDKDRNLRSLLDEDVLKTIQCDIRHQQTIEDEFRVMLEDRKNIRHIFPSGQSKVLFILMIVNLIKKYDSICISM